MEKKAEVEPQGKDKLHKPASQNSKPDTTPTGQKAGTGEVTWTASEYITHNKGVGWYALVILGAAAIAAMMHWLTRDVVSTVALVVIAGIFAVAAGLKPRVLTYRLDAAGLTIGKKFYDYGSFKSFAINQHGAIPSITFMPMQRFMPSISVYCAPDDQQKITDVLSKHLPLDPTRKEVVDSLMHRIRF